MSYAETVGRSCIYLQVFLNDYDKSLTAID
jgi:hypothetical protein